MEQIPGPPLREIGEAILSLADDPLPTNSAICEGHGGCLLLPIEGYSILYYIDERDDALTVLGVTFGHAQTLH
ncbi:MAG: type II toxin-antitoxin system RelE/ParE family toxin [Deltaproteobacteria bacterium]